MTTTVTVAPSPTRRRLRLGVGWASGRNELSPRWLVALVCVLAWALMVGARLAGVSTHLHHDAVAEAGAGPASPVALFLIGWVVMVTAMMLPVVAPALGAPAGRPTRVVGARLGGFLVPWTAAGIAVLSFDMAVHRLVDGLPALGARPWVVAVALLGVAGVAQLWPSTRRLAALGRSVAVAEKSGRAFAWGGQPVPAARSWC